MEKLIYEGKDITEDIHIIKAVHEMYAGGRQADTLELVLDDAEKTWNKWNPQAGDELEYINEDGKTGTMYVVFPEVSNGICTITATTLPKKAKEPHTKAWEYTTLSKIGEEVAGRFGHTFKLEKMEDVPYNYLCQRKESDISFLHRIAELEGCGIVIYNGAVTMFSEEKMENQEPSLNVETETSTFRACDSTGRMYGSCEVTAGAYKGIFIVDSSKPKFIPQENIEASSDAEAARFAKGILRKENKGLATATLETALASEITPGIVINVSNEVEAEWSGNLYVYRARHDYHSDTTKIFLRRPLEGY